MKCSRSKLAMVYLPVLAIIPVLIGFYQVLDFLNWLFDFEIDLELISWTCNFTPMVLFIFLLISVYEHFCVYYRMVLEGSMFMKISARYIVAHPEFDVLTHNVLNIIAVVYVCVGLMGCLVHFSIQIKDFIRYVRSRSKQNSH